MHLNVFHTIHNRSPLRQLTSLFSWLTALVQCHRCKKTCKKIPKNVKGVKNVFHVCITGDADNTCESRLVQWRVVKTATTGSARVSQHLKRYAGCTCTGHDDYKLNSLLHDRSRSQHPICIPRGTLYCRTIYCCTIRQDQIGTKVSAFGLALELEYNGSTSVPDCTSVVNLAQMPQAHYKISR